MKRRLRKRYGRSAYHVDTFKSQHVTVHMQYDPSTDEYRGDLSWPEIDDRGHVSKSLRHHLILRVPASVGSRTEAARRMIRESGLIGSPVHPRGLT